MDLTLRAPTRRVVRPWARPGWSGGGGGSTPGPMTRGAWRHTLAVMTRSRLVEAVVGDGSLARRLTMVTLVAATVLAVHAPGRTGSGAVDAGYLALVVVATAAWIAWTTVARGDLAELACLILLAAAGGLLAVASDDRDGVAAALLFAAVAAGAAAQRFPLRVALGVAAVATAALLADAARTPAAVAFAALVVPGTLATGLARRELGDRAEVAERLLAQEQRSREERARAAALDERLRVAREVHDVLAHSLTALAISLETAEVLLDEHGDLGRGLIEVRRARRLAGDGLAETRGAVAALRGTPVTLPDSLGRLLGEYRADFSVAATLVTTGAPRPLAAEPALALRRIAQEAVTTVRRHAPGAPIRAALDFGPRTVRLSIDNDLAEAAAASPGGGYGVRGMHERADACGGRLRAGAAGGRWRIDVELPA